MNKSSKRRVAAPKEKVMTPAKPPKWRAWLDYGMVALVFFLVNNRIQFMTDFFADTNDSFYHAKMGEMIGTHGIVQTFPWLFFTSLHEQFVDHHLLFHILLWPFVQLGNAVHALGLTELQGLFFGPKLLIVLSITGLFVLGYKILRDEGIRFPWVWLLLLFCVPYDFLFRMHMIRVQSISLLVMLGGLLALWNKKYLLLGILCFLYVWLYGGFFFLPIFVTIYVAVRYLQEKELDLTPIYWSFGGMILGFVLNPYFPKNLHFLYRQIFETGLGAELNVGGEWRPYDTWYIFQMGIVTFALQGIAVVWSLLKGFKQNARSITLFVISLFFLLLMWKSKRFVEYWPFFAVLSSAFLVKDYVQVMYVNRVRTFSVFMTAFTGFLLYGFLSARAALPESLLFLQDRVQRPWVIFLLTILVFCTLLAWVYSYMTVSQQKPPREKVVHEIALGLLLALLPIYAMWNMHYVIRDTRPNTAYLDGAEEVMRCIAETGRAQEGDIVFTDDWDIFPMLFFHNNTTNYIVGLDPIFMQAWNPSLYQEFANITMGQDGENLYEKIGGDFSARFVVADRDHSGLRNNIEATPGFTKICENATFAGYELAQR